MPRPPLAKTCTFLFFAGLVISAGMVTSHFVWFVLQALQQSQSPLFVLQL